MNLLDANDRPGAYPDSWYSATATPLPPFAPLKGRIKADLCIVGAGYTGLSAALHAAQAGLDVVLLDAQRVGFGASGRNGGQVGNSFNHSQSYFEKTLGAEAAKQLFEMGQAAAELTRELVARHAPDARYRPGLLHALRRPSEMASLATDAAYLQDRYGYDQLALLDQTAMRDILNSPDYIGGTLDMGAGHLHPLRYAFGLAQACVKTGLRIFEQSRVHHVAYGPPAIVSTAQGSVTAGHIIIATNGYGTALTPGTAAHVMPINNFIGATEPLGDRATSILRRDYCAHDDRFVVNYFRLSEDGRLLFGGGENYGYRFPSDIAATIRKPMEQVFPQIKGVKIDYAWGGTLAITMSRLPHIARPAPHVMSASGYSGSGVALAGFAGKLMAQAVVGQSSGLVALESLPTPRFPGGGTLRSPLLALAMTWYALRDRLGL